MSGYHTIRKQKLFWCFLGLQKLASSTMLNLVHCISVLVISGHSLGLWQCGPLTPSSKLSRVGLGKSFLGHVLNRWQSYKKKIDPFPYLQNPLWRYIDYQCKGSACRMDVVSGESRDGWRLLFHPTDAQLLSKVPHTMHCISYIIILYFPFPTSLYFLHHWIVFPNLMICFKRLSTSLCFLEYSTIFCLESQAILSTSQFCARIRFCEVVLLDAFYEGHIQQKTTFSIQR